MVQESLLSLLRRRWWLPIAVAIVAVIAAGVLALRSPHYQATASVVASVPTNANSQALSFPDVASTNAVATRALLDARVDETVAQLEGSTTVVASRSTLYDVSVSDPSPARAVALADAVAQESAALYSQLAGGAQVSIIDSLEKEREQYQTQSSAASQALQDFETVHPEVIAGTASPALLTQLHQLQLDQQTAQATYQSFQAAVAQARVAQVGDEQQFTAIVVDRAVAESQIKAQALRVGFAGALGLLVGLALTVAIEYIRSGRPPARHVQATDTEQNGHRDLEVRPASEPQTATHASGRARVARAVSEPGTSPP
jgi:uncharacterized protein involved in exopolysaccharide biosynthesis